MTPGWQQGREEIDALLADRKLERVPANAELAHAYLDQARAHVAASVQSVATDPIGAFQLAYDAARKALASLLLMQGIRPTRLGGHVAVHDAVDAQFGDAMGSAIRPFTSMRRLRNSSEYPSLDKPVATADDARRAQADATKMIEAAAQLIGRLPAF